ncbi:MAG TPA: HPF/RaiA family ribosome-associated protein [Candidatus Eisenbacteria bacterium]
MIEIRGIPVGPALRTRVTRELTSAVARLPETPVRVQASFFDDNGPKGGRAIRCSLTFRVPYRPNIRVEHTADTARLAFDESIATLERELARYRERDRENKRHPKKYFAARRLLSGREPEASGAPEPRRPSTPAGLPPRRRERP